MPHPPYSDWPQEALENKEQKERNRKRQYDKKRDDKKRQRDLYYLRHRLDYEVRRLEAHPGSSGCLIGQEELHIRPTWRNAVRCTHPVASIRAYSLFSLLSVCTGEPFLFWGKPGAHPPRSFFFSSCDVRG